MDTLVYQSTIPIFQIEIIVVCSFENSIASNEQQSTLGSHFPIHTSEITASRLGTDNINLESKSAQSQTDD